MYFWLNVDLPTSLACLHMNSCRHARDISPTELKGVGRMKRDGGWTPFESPHEAQAYIENLGRNVAFQRCDECSP